MAIEKTVEELARLLGAQAEGKLQARLTGVAQLGSASDNDLSFVESARNADEALASRAGCLLAPPGLNLLGRTVIRVRNPRYAMALAIGILHPQPIRKPGIDATAQIGDNVVIGEEVSIAEYAIIGDGCRIGARTRIGAGCVLRERSVLGEDCLLHPRVTLYAGAQIGARVILHSGAVIGSDGFGYAREAGKYHKFPQIGSVEVGDDVEIGANTTIDRGALGLTRIGQGTKIDNLVQIAHNVQIGANCAIAAQVGISGSVVIGDNVVIAGQVGIGDHARIESGVVLGGQCGILPHKIVKAGAVPGEPLWGTPARPVREHLKQQALVARLAKKQKG
ncbi:MAG: UDP-3-O-(3-hydroxymyristoyl)glucosamine N-acyltransferase [Acidobacteria bacterium]|nr:UDP-3-O-(3-hydroxymyristoyl)glucosamine N-acyltransferase [Acidobacteriota bacterium]